MFLPSGERATADTPNVANRSPGASVIAKRDTGCAGEDPGLTNQVATLASLAITNPAAPTIISRRERSHRRGVRLQNLRHQAGLALTFKRLLACRHFVDHHAKCKNVRAGVRFLSFDLLRGHVLKRSQDRPLRREGVIRSSEF